MPTELANLKALLAQCRKYIEDAIEYVEHDEHIIAKKGRELLDAIDNHNKSVKH